MRKLIHSLILGLFYVVQLSAEENIDKEASRSVVGQVQTGGAETAGHKQKESSAGIDPFTKDIFDIVSKVVSGLSLIVAIFVAVHQINKYKEERVVQSERDREQRQKEIEERQLNTRINRARFWLELRRMFDEHNEVHFKLQNHGEWSENNTGPQSKEEWSKTVSYMGIFEHRKRMLDDELIDFDTFNSIYGYRVDNILKNQIIVTEQLIKYQEGWEIFLELVKKLGKTVPV